MLGEAFAEDPVVRWLLPSGRGVARMFEILAHHQHGLDGGTDIAVDDDGRILGASLWDRPGYRQSTRDALLALPGLSLVLGRGLPRAATLEEVMHQRRPPLSFWYLAAIGASAKGRGVGSALLEHRLARITGPAYLESSNIANVPLYERFGFRLAEEIHLPGGGPTLYPMLRDREENHEHGDSVRARTALGSDCGNPL